MIKVIATAALAIALLLGATVAPGGVAGARAAVVGRLQVRVQGTLGTPVYEADGVTAWQFPADVSGTGIVAFEGVTQTTIVDFDEGDPDRPIVVGSVYSTEIVTRAATGTATFACDLTTGACTVQGALVGRGTVAVDVLELATDGRVAWQTTFDRVLCRICSP